jgi:hypothetical protein
MVNAKKSDQLLAYYIKTNIDDPPVITSVYGLNLERRILDEIWLKVDNSDIP